MLPLIAAAVFSVHPGPAVRIPVHPQTCVQGPGMTCEPSLQLPVEPRRGRGLMISGIVVAGVIGVPLTLAGAILLISANRSADGVGEGASVLTFATLPVGLVGLAIGVPMLAVGIHRHRVYKAWQRSQIEPSAGRTSHGTWTLGLTLRM
jgi:hypothetical protein